MGSLNIPPSSLVYIDANTLIYSVERVEPYWKILEPLWINSAEKRPVRMISSELLILESLVGPRKKNLPELERKFEDVLQSSELNLLRISVEILREAVVLRSTSGLKTPDAIHAATALLANCTVFLTNDLGFRRVPGLPVLILDDFISP